MQGGPLKDLLIPDELAAIGCFFQEVYRIYRECTSGCGSSTCKRDVTVESRIGPLKALHMGGRRYELLCYLTCTKGFNAQQPLRLQEGQ